MPRLQRADLIGDAEEFAEEILEMGREIDQEIGLVLAWRASAGSRRAVTSRSCKLPIAGGEIGHERGIEPDEPVARPEIGEGEAVFQDGLDHNNILIPVILRKELLDRCNSLGRGSGKLDLGMADRRDNRARRRLIDSAE